MKDLKSKLCQEYKNRSHIFNIKKAHHFIEHLFDVLFFCEDMESIDDILVELKNNFVTILNNIMFKEVAIHKSILFFDELTKIYSLLLKDAKFILKNDPAAKSIEEVYSYLGFFAIVVYRLSNQLHQLSIPLLPRILSEYAHSKTGIDIHPAAQIGNNFFIDHGTGVVIGETCVIGNNVKLFQGVTLGAISVSKKEALVKRHPTIEDNVVIYSGATILGGTTTIGANSTIGGNVWLTSSIPPNTKVFHKSQIIVKGKEVKQESINYII